MRVRELACSLQVPRMPSQRRHPKPWCQTASTRAWAEPQHHTRNRPLLGSVRPCGRKELRPDLKKKGPTTPKNLQRQISLWSPSLSLRLCWLYQTRLGGTQLQTCHVAADTTLTYRHNIKQNWCFKGHPNHIITNKNGPLAPWQLHECSAMLLFYSYIIWLRQNCLSWL